MRTIIETTATRLYKFRQYLGLNQTEMGKKLGISQPAYTAIESGKSELKNKHLISFYESDKLSVEWLLTGNGEMLYNPSQDAFSSKNINSKTNSSRGLRPIPFYDLDVFAGKIELSQEDQPHLTESLIYLPGLSDCDCALRVKGDSMTPVINNNDIIGIRRSYLNTLNWRKLHVIITENTRLVKYVYKGEGNTILLQSANSDYEPQIIPLSEVLFFYEVSIIMQTKKP